MKMRDRTAGALRKSGAVFALVALAGSIALMGTSMGQGPAEEFEVVSIKPSEAGSKAFITLPAIRGSEWRATNATADTFIAFAYDSATGAATASDPRIVGGPTWLKNTRFTVAAKIPSGSPSHDVPRMVQSMLAERFQLKMHRETRTLAAYSMKLAPGGSKLKANEDCASATSPRLSDDGLLCGSIAIQPAKVGQTAIGRGVTTEQIADWISGNYSSERDRPLADLTGLQGHFDFTFTWIPESSRASNAAGLSHQQIANDNIRILERAVNNQLGIRLDLTKLSKQPVQVWVIDHMTMPSPD